MLPLPRGEGRLLLQRAEAGICARRRTHFSCLAKKSEQKKATQLFATPALRSGATCVGAFAGCAVELATRCALHSDNHGESDVEARVSCGTHATPQTPRHRRIQMGWFRAFASLGLGATRRYAPVLGGRAQRRSGTIPPNPSTAGCPKRSAGTQTSGRLLLLTFLGEARKVSAPPGAYPGLHTSKSKCYKLRSKVPP